MENLDLLTGEFIFFGPDKQQRMGNPAEVSKAMVRWHAKLYRKVIKKPAQQSGLFYQGGDQCLTSSLRDSEPQRRV